MYEDIQHDIGSTVAIHGTTLRGLIDTPWLENAMKSLTDALLDKNDKSIPENVREAFLKDFEAFCKAQNIEFDRNNRQQAASAIIGQFRLAAMVPKALGALSVFTKGLWYRSTGVIKGEAWLKNNDITKAGGKVATVIKVCQGEGGRACN